jgi:ATP-grasp in the biosynthetic pathway with Ter operon
MRHKVLVFPAGSEIGMEIYQSLKYSHHVEVFGASGKNDHASFLYEPTHYVEDAGLYVDSPDFIERFNALLRRLDIGFVYPTHDTICNFLAEHQASVAAKVITSNAKTNRIARHKRLSYAHFDALGLSPRVHRAPYADLPWPVYLKTNTRQGGKGSHRADSAEELAFHLRGDPDLLVCEYLPGEELSVDCFTDFRGELLFVGPRTRERVLMGISFRSTAVEPDDELRHIAETINRSLELDGAWFFQVKHDAAGRWKLLELAPRQSSTMGLYRHAGVNFALLSLFNAMRIPVQILRNDGALQLDRCLHNRFKTALEYSRVYIDFDETMVVGRHVHGRVMDYLYQCRNRGVRIVLITKHRENLAATLAACAISERLFDEIVHLRDEQDKADFIDPEGAIFIDNYWHDRRAVKARHGIPVFDVDAVEGLMN